MKLTEWTNLLAKRIWIFIQKLVHWCQCSHEDNIYC